MIAVSVPQLVAAIEEADAFSLPDMSAGTEYLYANIYGRLSCGDEVRLSEIDFRAFTLDDVDTMRELYSHTLDAHDDKAEAITRTLRGLPPVVTTAAFV